MKSYMKYFGFIVFAVMLLFLRFQVSGTNTVSADPFDFATGNSGIEIIIPTAAPHIFANVSPSGGDAPLVFRYTMLITNAWLDAVAPYHPTAIGACSDLGRLLKV